VEHISLELKAIILEDFLYLNSPCEPRVTLSLPYVEVFALDESFEGKVQCQTWRTVNERLHMSLASQKSYFD
jgi:hypothetical protein